MDLNSTKNCYRCGERFLMGHSWHCKALMRNCFNCHRTGHLAKVCRAAQQTIASVARVVVQKSARKKERDQRRWKEFQSRKLEILELPFSGLTQPELLALDLVYEQPFHQRKQRHVSVKDRVCSINAQNDRLQARNLELSSKIETYKEKNKVLERKIQNMKYNEQEIELYQTNINDLKIMLQNKTHEINVLEVQLTDSDYQGFYDRNTSINSKKKLRVSNRK